MAGYTLKITEKPFKSGKNILASEHFQFIEGGATLDASAIGAKTLEAGTAIVRNTTTGKFEEYNETTPGTFEDGYDEPAILNVNVDVDGVNDVVVGEVIVRGSVYDAKIIGATDAFKEANKNIRYVKHI
ncbi:hypothetical protein Q8A72_06825 [Aeribacillus pallidus]|nr:hypothetical protein [Aeribacillus pallidus]